MNHDFSLVFDTENSLWQRVLNIFEENEKYEKKRIKERELHHKFPRSFSKRLGEEIDNDEDNLVSLSPADHFLVHYYYYKLAKKGFRISMALAFRLMARKGLKYITPDTAEAIAKDYEEASEDLSPLGRKHTESTKKKMSESAIKAATPKLRKLRSESRKGEPHPHKSGRKGLPISEFGKLFYAHYGFTSSGHTVLYRSELAYWREHNKCSWEQMDDINNSI